MPDHKSRGLLAHLVRAEMDRASVDEATAWARVLADPANAETVASSGWVGDHDRVGAPLAVITRHPHNHHHGEAAMLHTYALKTYATRFDAGAEIDRRVRRYQTEHAGTDYETAMAFVLDADVDLKLAYAHAPDEEAA